MTAAAKPKNASGVRLTKTFRSGEGGGASLLSEGRGGGGRLLSRHRIRLSPAASPGTRAAFALYRNFMMMDCYHLFDSLDDEGT
ncbi:hypothetical protein HOP50_09g55880 [Chloropicon primus]|nr:hypothetical protein HOP50_09g55880 [Chloropicon primus]